ncbi:MAG: DUF1573 domain-containing protein [Paramuribaculum sp.]|nr:DUF1573 domain-containing protein [Paramuribaculum sp.]
MIDSQVKVPKTLPGFNTGIPIDEYIDGCEYAIISYINGEGCIGCRMRLNDWKKEIEQLKIVCGVDVRLVMVANPLDSSSLAYDLKMSNFTYPVYYDKMDSFRILNSLPEERSLQTFLIDTNMKIIAVGNPVYNAKIAKLYSKIINGDNDNINDSMELIPKPITFTPSYIQLGSVKSNERKVYKVSLHNTTDSVIKISELSTSCSCIEATLCVDSLMPNERQFLNIKLHKDTILGYFERYINVTIKNYPEQIQLLIDGFGVDSKN